MRADIASYERRSVCYIKKRNKERLLEVRNMIAEVKNSIEGLKRQN